MIIKPNLSSSQVQKNNLFTKPAEKLITSKKANADAALASSVISQMEKDISALNASVQKNQDYSAIYKIANGALGEASSTLSRMREIAMRAASSGTSAAERSVLSQEMNDLSRKLASIPAAASYNSQPVLNGNFDVMRQNAKNPPPPPPPTAGPAGPTANATQKIDGEVKITNYYNMLSEPVPGQIKVLAAPENMKEPFELAFSANSPNPAQVSARGTSFNGAIGINGNISINGVNIDVKSTDTTSSIVEKINNANLGTGVIASAINASGGQAVSMISGKFDANVINETEYTKVGNYSSSRKIVSNGLGYDSVGYVSNGPIKVGGDTEIWKKLGFSNSFTSNGNDVSLSELTTNGVKGGEMIPYSVMLTDKTGGVFTNIELSPTAEQNIGMVTDKNSKYYGLKIDFSEYAKNSKAIINKYSDNSYGPAGIYFEASIKVNSVSTSAAPQASTTAPAPSDRYASGASAQTSAAVPTSPTARLAAGANISSAADANRTLAMIDRAMNEITKTQANVGATISRLDSSMMTLMSRRENLSAGLTRLNETDVVSDVSKMIKDMLGDKISLAVNAHGNLNAKKVASLLAM